MTKGIRSNIQMTVINCSFHTIYHFQLENIIMYIIYRDSAQEPTKCNQIMKKETKCYKCVLLNIADQSPSVAVITTSNNFLKSNPVHTSVNINNIIKGSIPLLPRPIDCLLCL